MLECPTPLSLQAFFSHVVLSPTPPASPLYRPCNSCPPPRAWGGGGERREDEDAGVRHPAPTSQAQGEGRLPLLPFPGAAAVPALNTLCPPLHRFLPMPGPRLRNMGPRAGKPSTPTTVTACHTRVPGSLGVRHLPSAGGRGRHLARASGRPGCAGQAPEREEWLSPVL